MNIIKFKFIIGLAIFFVQVYKAQGNVGINTSNPLTKFHVDGQKNTSSSTDALTKDDFFVTSEGKVGIGVATPIAKVDVRNTQNTDNAVGIGTTTQTALEAGAGALRYEVSNGIQYSNGTEWVSVAPPVITKTIVAATKDTWGSTDANVFCYNGGFNSN